MIALAKKRRRRAGVGYRVPGFRRKKYRWRVPGEEIQVPGVGCQEKGNLDD